MRTIVVLGRRHGSKKLELVSASNDGKEAVKALDDFKKSSATHVHKTYELLELWASDGGRRKQRKFISEADAKRIADEEAKRKKDAEAAKAKSEPKSEDPAPGK
jgi:hypothetical protein